MSYLYLDLETIPTQSDEVKARIADNITPPANYKKAESIEAWDRDQKPALVKEAVAKTALDGSAGHICCIGWAFDEGPVNAIHTSTGISEADTLEDFVDAISAAVKYAPTIVGHNVANFDIRFLWQRAIVLGVKMPAWFPRDPKPWSSDVFDTMTAFAGQRNTIGLDRLCQALSLPGKDEIDGSMIADLWTAGEHEKIAEYCRSDVERTRNVHRRMLIAYGEAA